MKHCWINRCMNKCITVSCLWVFTQLLLPTGLFPILFFPLINPTFRLGLGINSSRKLSLNLAFHISLTTNLLNDWWKSNFMATHSHRKNFTTPSHYWFIFLNHIPPIRKHHFMPRNYSFHLLFSHCTEYLYYVAADTVPRVKIHLMYLGRT